MHIGRLAHVAIGAGEHRDEMLHFYRELLGVIEVARRGETVFLAGGKKPAYDVALVPGQPGLHHIAFEVAGPEDLVEARDRLEGAGVEVEALDVSEDPGIADGISFVIPSGHAFELVLLAEPKVFSGTPSVGHQHFVGAGPVDLEHVSVDCNDVELAVAFLRDTVGFLVTEYSVPPEGPWFFAFLRTNELHHDLGMFRHNQWDGPGFNHVGFAVPSIVEIARVADIACALGWKLQCSPGRHLVGDNIFVYIVDPSGNRVEVGTPMAKIERSAKTRSFDASGDVEWGGFDGWRTGIPPQARTPGACIDARVGVGAGDQGGR
jgi:catechol 2,3-dioxygenase